MLRQSKRSIPAADNRMDIAMAHAFSLRAFRNLANRSLNPGGMILRLDAAYRERRRMEELSDEHLIDVGLTRADIDRIFGRR